jgi:hypothetical protein
MTELSILATENVAARHLAAYAALLVSYWLVDLGQRREGLVGVLRRLGVRSADAEVCLVLVPAAAAAVAWPWASVTHGAALRGLALVLVLPLAWKAATQDIDPARGDARWLDRLAIVASGLGAIVSPAFLVPSVYLLTSRFQMWEHHATLPLRLAQATIAYLVAVAIPKSSLVINDVAMLLALLVTIQVSHYFITALAKARLGPRWYSWVTDNRLHYIAASAYSWGWSRWIPWARYRRFVAAVRAGEKPMQLVVYAVEALAPVALLHPTIALVMCGLWAGFHAMVFVTTGLLFWDWMAANAAVAVLILMLPDPVLAQAFGPLSFAVGMVVMFALPFRHKLWKPMPLGWWDTPFTQRVHWRVRGQSGAVYGLYSDFMCPHERLYGRVHGCFFVPHKAMTYHLGEVWKRELRDAIIATRGEPRALDEARERFGIDTREPAMAAHHRAYLRRVFSQLNAGARKHVLPRWLRWLKAPGGQIYYWGDLPAYRGQEPVVAVELHYREEFYDGKELQVVKVEHLTTIEIGDALASPEPVHELSPKELDAMLIGRANGRLIDLPSWGDGLIKGDDGGRAGDVLGASRARERAAG